MIEEVKCRTCGTKVIHCRDIEGTRIILDARQHPIYEEVSEGVWRRVYDVRVTHFATCPQASQHSRRKKVRGGKRGE